MRSDPDRPGMPLSPVLAQVPELVSRLALGTIGPWGEQMGEPPAPPSTRYREDVASLLSDIDREDEMNDTDELDEGQYL